MEEKGWRLLRTKMEYTRLQNEDGGIRKGGCGGGGGKGYGRMA